MQLAPALTGSEISDGIPHDALSLVGAGVPRVPRLPSPVDQSRLALPAPARLDGRQQCAAEAGVKGLRCLGRREMEDREVAVVVEVRERIRRCAELLGEAPCRRVLSGPRTASAGSSTRCGHWRWMRAEMIRNSLLS
jgi:hypothetical protein